MEAERFFARWSRRKTQSVDAAQVVVADASANAAPPVPVDDTATPHPTLDDVAALTPESDFTPFMARGVDQTVRRSAMKKLFADPHFNVMDGLDTYVGDFHTFEPIPPAMLAMLNHAQALLNPLAQLESPLMRLLESPVEQALEQAGASAPQLDQAALAESVTIPAQASADSSGIAAIDATKDTEPPTNDDPI